MDPAADAVDRLAAAIGAAADRRPDRALRVAISGITGSGKTTLAAHLRLALVRHGRSVIAVRADDFHHPRAVRYRRGRESAEGYYRDAFDTALLRRSVLDPLDPGGDACIRMRGFDLERDVAIDEEPHRVRAGDIVLVEGSFLLRPELRGGFDYAVFVRASFETAERRGASRDAVALGSEDNARRLYRVRYHAAQRIHLDEIDVERDADAVFDTEDLERPVLRFRDDSAGSTPLPA
jgi:uridine kinase